MGAGMTDRPRTMRKAFLGSASRTTADPEPCRDCGRPTRSFVARADPRRWLCASCDRALLAAARPARLGGQRG